MGDQGRERISLLDLYERSFVLLSAAGTPWRAAAAQVAEQLSARLAGYTIGSAADADLVQPADADWTEVHEIAAGGAVLVRPDGFVAWRCEDAVADPQEALLTAMMTVLRRD